MSFDHSAPPIQSSKVGPPVAVPSAEFLVQQAIQARSFHPCGEATPFAQAALEGSIVARFEEMVLRYPDRLAVWHDSVCLTYRELNAQANQVAHAVLAQPEADTRPVLLLFRHTPAAIIALLGVLKAGCFCAPLDPLQPTAHLSARVMDSQARLILTDRDQRAIATAVNDVGATLLCLDDLAGSGTPANPARSIGAETNALLLYTSGSTGQPKGILLNHRALLHRVKRQQAIVHLSSEDRCACVHLYNAIAGLRDLLCPLLNGAATCLFDLQTHSLAEFPTWVQQEGMTILGFVTPTLRHLLNLLTAGTAFSQVRLVCIGGDTLYRQDVERYRQHFPTTCVLYNSLGATETAGGFCYYLFDHQSALPENPLPVGYPMNDMQIMIVDQAGQPLPNGEPGEIVLATPYLARGYWRQPTQTVARFQPTTIGDAYFTGDSGWLRADGCLIHLGRIDNQVKIHGYRVELGEVERALLRHPAVQEAVVITQKREPGETQLLAYWVAKPRMAAASQELHTWLSAKLPAPMVPRLFVALGTLPLTANGKVDRHALPTPDFTLGCAAETSDAARTPTEQTLSELWRALLKVEQIGIHDNFFRLGGHSLLVVQMLLQVEQQFQQAIDLRQFIFRPTIAHLATLLSEQREVEPSWEAQPASQSPSLPLSAEEEAILCLYDTLEDKAQRQQLHNDPPKSMALPYFLRILLSLPQAMVMPCLTWTLQQRWVQRRYLPKQTALARQFLVEVAQTPKQQNLLAQCLLFGCLSHFKLRKAIFQRIKATRTIPIEGLAMLDAARAQQQGVILLTSHTYLAPYFHSFQLAQSRIKSIDTMIKEVKLDKVMAAHIWYTYQLALARQTLQAGGVISIGPDVNRGYDSPITMPLHGRMHKFSTSFAELALLTDAQIFFVASDLQAYDQFRFRLVGPFDRGIATLDHAERVQYLMEQYVTLLHQQWAKYPWALPWWLMSEHLAYPPAESAESEVFNCAKQTRT